MKLTIEERVKLLNGKDTWHTQDFNKLPTFMMADGPHGLRKQIDHGDNLGIGNSEVATLFPTASLLASSFDKKLMFEVGKALGMQAKAQKINMILGPGINIKRTPLCGRNFEYFSEDPYLTGVLASNYVKGVESVGIGTSVKHFFANNQEKYRLFIDSIVDERALNEIYLKAFKMVSKEKPASFMTSYNKINGYFGSEHPYINDLLRNKWKYDGMIVSDWGAIDNRINSLKAGNDLQMPSSKNYHTKILLNAVDSDQTLKDYINISSDRIIHTINKYQIKDNIEIDFDKSHDFVENVALSSLVLLENKDIFLPLNKEKTTAIIGGFIDNIRVQGGGSSHVNPYKVDQIKDVASLYFNDCLLSKGYHLENDEIDNNLLEDAINTAKKAEQIIYFMGLPERLETEGIDRKNLNIPFNQVKVLEELKKVNPNIVIVLLTGSVIETSYSKNAKAMILAYLAGEAAANAIFKTITGLSNPSGRLAETWLNNTQNIPLITNDNHAVYYEESIFVGYRKYISYNHEVAYPFGYGLSYGNVSYNYLGILEMPDKYILNIELENKTNLITKEVVQIYLENLKSSVYKAKKELVSFEKYTLEPFEKKIIAIEVLKENFEFFDIESKDFKFASGKYNLHISKNALDSIISIEVEVKGNLEMKNEVENPWDLYHPNDFAKIYGKPLPPKNIEFNTPFSLSTPAFALKKTLPGRLIIKYLLKEGTKQVENSKDTWMKSIIETTLLETPMRGIASFGNGVVNYQMIEGIVDIANYKLIKGIKKFKKGVSELKDGE